jgi:hypothetical protein
MPMSPRRTKGVDLSEGVEEPSLLVGGEGAVVLATAQLVLTPVVARDRST